MKTPPRHSRAFALIELMTVIIILIAFLFLASRVFTLTMRQMHAVPAAANRMASIEQIRGILARDLWSAVDLRQPDPQTLLLLDGKGTLISWRMASEGRLSRSTIDAAAHWTDLQGLSLTREAGAVVLTQRSRTWTIPAPLLTEVKP